MSNALALTASNFDEKISSGVAVVDFWAAWCGPCRMLSPVIDELAADFEGRCAVYKVNVDEEGELAARFGVMTIPTVIIFKDGEIVDKSIGVVPKERFEQAVNAAL